uniref:Uncharacterized protein n=1 Tax=Alexandrium monilatum TaxID=311494 RepID=A0A6T1KVA6_9DINO
MAVAASYTMSSILPCSLLCELAALHSASFAVSSFAASSAVSPSPPAASVRMRASNAASFAVSPSLSVSVWVLLGVGLGAGVDRVLLCSLAVAFSSVGRDAGVDHGLLRSLAVALRVGLGAGIDRVLLRSPASEARRSAQQRARHAKRAERQQVLQPRRGARRCEGPALVQRGHVRRLVVLLGLLGDGVQRVAEVHLCHQPSSFSPPLATAPRRSRHRAAAAAPEGGRRLAAMSHGQAIQWGPHAGSTLDVGASPLQQREGAWRYRHAL